MAKRIYVKKGAEKKLGIYILLNKKAHVNVAKSEDKFLEITEKTYAASFTSGIRPMINSGLITEDIKEWCNYTGEEVVEELPVLEAPPVEVIVEELLKEEEPVVEEEAPVVEAKEEITLEEAVEEVMKVADEVAEEPVKEEVKEEEAPVEEESAKPKKKARKPRKKKAD